MLEDLDNYKDKRDKFAATHLWPHFLADGTVSRKTLKPAWQFWNGCAVRNAATDLAPFATVQTARIGSNSISERDHKLHKFIMSKCRCGRLRRDCLRGKGSLAIDIVLHRENLKFIGGQQSQDDESSQVEIVLHLFLIGIESHFMA